MKAIGTRKYTIGAGLVTTRRKNGSCTHRNKADRRHLISGEGARFVSADDGCTSQRLHRRQFANDYVPFCHAPRA